MEVILLKPGEEIERWNALVATSPQANPFASALWLESLAETVGGEWDRWVVAKGDEWFAALGVVYRRRFGRKAAMQPPLTQYVSPVFSASTGNSTYPASNTSAHLSICRALARGVASEYSAVSQTLLPDISDIRPWLWEGWDVVPSYTYHVDLHRELRPSHSLRKHVKHCDDAGITLSREWNIDALLPAIQATSERQGIRFGLRHERLSQLAHKLHAAGMAYMDTAVTAQGEPLSCRVQLWLPGSDTVYDWVAGSLPGGLAAGATSWLMPQLVAKYRAAGARRWDMCGANFENVATYKATLGGTLVHGFRVLSPRTIPERMYQSTRRLASRMVREAAAIRRKSA